MSNSREAISVVSKDRTGLATGTGVGKLRLILAGFALDYLQSRFCDIADLLAERLPDEDKRFVLYDEKSEKERLEYNQVMDLLYKFGVCPSRGEINVKYPMGFRSPYDFLDLLGVHNQQRGGVQISPMPHEDNELPHTDLGIKSSFPGVVIHFIHNEEVFGNEWPLYQEIQTLYKLGISRIELEVTPQAYELPHIK